MKHEDRQNHDGEINLWICEQTLIQLLLQMGIFMFVIVKKS